MGNILLFVLAIAIPIYGIYGTIFGAIEKDNDILISGIVCLAITIFFIATIIYAIKHPKDGQKQKQALTPEEQRQRSLAFVKKHSKAFLTWSIVSIVLAVASLILLIIFVDYNFSFYFSIPMLAFTMIFIALFASYMGVEWKNKNNKTIGKIRSNSTDSETIKQQKLNEAQQDDEYNKQQQIIKTILEKRRISRLLRCDFYKSNRIVTEYLDYEKNQKKLFLRYAPEYKMYKMSFLQTNNIPNNTKKAFSSYKSNNILNKSNFQELYEKNNTKLSKFQLNLQYILKNNKEIIKLYNKLQQ